MNKGIWERYTLAVYVFILALSVILGLIGFSVFDNENAYQTLFFYIN